MILELRNRIDAYFALVLRNVRDSVPKAVGHYLVRATQVKKSFCFDILILNLFSKKDNLQFSLYNHINKSKSLMALLSEVLPSSFENFCSNILWNSLQMWPWRERRCKRRWRCLVRLHACLRKTLSIYINNIRSVILTKFYKSIVSFRQQGRKRWRRGGASGNW